MNELEDDIAIVVSEKPSLKGHVNILKNIDYDNENTELQDMTIIQ